MKDKKMEKKTTRRALFKRSATVALAAAAGVLAPTAFDTKSGIKIGKMDIPAPSYAEAHADCMCGSGYGCAGAGKGKR
jgi:anaerobic selenocysteine-containing dehydrogenase